VIFVANKFTIACVMLRKKSRPSVAGGVSFEGCGHKSEKRADL